MVENYRNLCPTWTLSLLGWIQDFSARGSMKRQGSHLVGGSAGILPQKFGNFKSSLRNMISAILRRSKSACFNISFFKVKMPFFLHQNITESSETTMQICICKTMIKIYCINFTIFNFVFHRTWDQQEAFFGIFPQKTEPQHRSQWAFRNECSS